MSSGLDIIYMTKRPEKATPTERDRPVEIEITPQMIEAGVSILRREFGGETEGQNRYVDFPETVRALLRTALCSF